MFEGFTPAARDVVLAAADVSARLGDDMIRSEHLLLGVLQIGGQRPPVDVLVAAGVTPETVLDHVRDFLGPRAAQDVAVLGIDLRRVRERVEEVFGVDALREVGPRWPRMPFSPDAKAAVNQTVPEAQDRGSEVVDVVDILTAVLHPGMTEAEQQALGRDYAVMARREGLYDGEKTSRRIVHDLGADPDELRMRLRAGR